MAKAGGQTASSAENFSLSGQEKTGKVSLVDQLRESWNPLLAWLRDVHAWGQVAGAAVE